jgi:uncharacterized delta-60 repeat protein
VLLVEDSHLEAFSRQEAKGNHPRFIVVSTTTVKLGLGPRVARRSCCNEQLPMTRGMNTTRWRGSSDSTSMGAGLRLGRRVRMPPSVISLVGALVFTAGMAGPAAALPSTSWGTKGSVTIPSVVARGLGQDAQGRVLVFGYTSTGPTRAVVAALTSTGALDASFGRRGFVYWPPSVRLPYLTWDFSASLPDGDTVLAGSTYLADGIVAFGKRPEDTRLVLAEIDRYGRQVRSFGEHGLYVASRKSCLRGATGLADPEGRIVVATVEQCTSRSAPTIALVRLTARGTVDPTFGHAGIAAVANLPSISGTVTPIAVTNGHIVVALPTSGGRVEVAMLDAAGTPVPGFGKNGTTFAQVASDSSSWGAVTALIVAKLNRLTVTGCTFAGPFMVRFNRGGSPYHFWGGGHYAPTNVEQFGGGLGAVCASFAQLRNHKLVAAGTALVRLYPSGFLDPFHGIVALPYFAPQTPFGPIHPLLVGTDGRLFVATSVRAGVAIVSGYHF